MNKAQEWNEKIKPVVVKDLNGIKMVLKPFLVDNPDQERTIQCEMGWENEGKAEKSIITSKSSGFSYRKTLIDGLDVIRKRKETMEKLKKATKEAQANDMISTMEVWDVNKMRFNVDALIERRLGGKRNGCRVRWVVNEGIFEYDPFTDKLFEIEGDSDD